jgi:hypothetical protein
VYLATEALPIKRPLDRQRVTDILESLDTEPAQQLTERIKVSGFGCQGVQLVTINRNVGELSETSSNFVFESPFRELHGVKLWTRLDYVGNEGRERIRVSVQSQIHHSETGQHLLQQQRRRQRELRLELRPPLLAALRNGSEDLDIE